MMGETSIKNSKTIIPKSILKKFGVEEGDVIRWDINNDGKIELEFDEMNESKLSIEEVAEDLGMTPKELMDDLKEAEKDFKEGKSISMDDIAKELGVDLLEKQL